MLKATRHTVLLIAGIALFVAGVSLITSCAPKNKGPTEITLWDFMSGGDGIRWKQIIDDFNSSQNDVKVTSTTLTWGDTFYTKVHTAVVSGQTPDVMSYHLSHFPVGIKAGDLRPITEAELKTVGLSFNDFNPALVAKATDIASVYGKAGSMYGIPLDTHTSILFYNKNLFKKAGLLDANGLPTGLTGIDNFVATMKKFKSMGALPLAFSSSQDSATVWRLFSTLFYQQGGSFFVNGKFSMDQLDTLGVKTLQTMTDWTTKGYIPANAAYPAAIALFSSGKAAMMVNGDWESTTMQDLQKNGKLPFEYGLLAIPKLYDNQLTWADSHQICIPASKKVSAAKLKAVLQFAAYVEHHAITWAGCGHIPAYLPVLNSKEMADLSPNNQFAVQAAKDVALEPVSTAFGVGTPALDYVDNFFTPALNGKLPVADAIAKFKSSVQDALK